MGWREQKGFPGGVVVKNLPDNQGDAGSICGLGRSHGVGNGNPLQYSCLENSMDRGAWTTIVHGVAKGQTWLSMREDGLLRLWRKQKILVEFYVEFYVFLFY